LLKNSAIVFSGAKNTNFLSVFLFLSPAWCENKIIKMNKVLFLVLGEFNGKY